MTSGRTARGVHLDAGRPPQQTLRQLAAGLVGLTDHLDQSGRGGLRPPKKPGHARRHRSHHAGLVEAGGHQHDLGHAVPLDGTGDLGDGLVRRLGDHQRHPGPIEVDGSDQLDARLAHQLGLCACGGQRIRGIDEDRRTGAHEW